LRYGFEWLRCTVSTAAVEPWRKLWKYLRISTLYYGVFWRAL
jgi:hypothetical protein